MVPAMARQKGDLAAFQFAQDKGVGGVAKGRLHALFMHVCESRHRIEPAAANNSDFRLSQCPLLFRPGDKDLSSGIPLMLRGPIPILRFLWSNISV